MVNGRVMPFKEYPFAIYINHTFGICGNVICAQLRSNFGQGRNLEGKRASIAMLSQNFFYRINIFRVRILRFFNLIFEKTESKVGHLWSNILVKLYISIESHSNFCTGMLNVISRQSNVSFHRSSIIDDQKYF